MFLVRVNIGRSERRSFSSAHYPFARAQFLSHANSASCI